MARIWSEERKHDWVTMSADASTLSKCSFYHCFITCANRPLLFPERCHFSFLFLLLLKLLSRLRTNAIRSVILRMASIPCRVRAYQESCIWRKSGGYHPIRSKHSALPPSLFIIAALEPAAVGGLLLSPESVVVLFPLPPTASLPPPPL